jgi:hypothetical protein
MVSSAGYVSSCLRKPEYTADTLSIREVFVVGMILVSYDGGRQIGTGGKWSSVSKSRFLVDVGVGVFNKISHVLVLGEGDVSTDWIRGDSNAENFTDACGVGDGIPFS